MKKIKSKLLFICSVFALTMIFCTSAFALSDAREGEIEYKYDEDTGIMTINGTGGTLYPEAFYPYSVSSNKNVIIGNIKEESCVVSDQDREGDGVEFWDYEPNAIAGRAAIAAKVVIVDKSVKELKPACFVAFENAEIIILPDNITTIPTAAFYDLDKLKTVILSPETVTIEDYAFAGCTNLKTINLTNTVKYIDEHSFKDCNTNYITIPDSVEAFSESRSYIPENFDSYSIYSIRGGYVGIRWNRHVDCTAYRVFRRVDGSWKKLVDIPWGAWGAHLSLDEGTTHTLAVRPYNKINGKLYFAEKYVKITVTTGPAKPTLKVTSTKAGTASFTWNNVSGETGYQLWYSTKENGKYTKISNYKANTVSASKSGLTGGKTYYFKIRAYKSTTDGYVYSYYSSPVEMKIATTTSPATPTLKVTSTKTGTASFTWNNVSGETGYQIWYSTAQNGKYTKISNYKANAVSASKNGLKSGSTYYFKIRAYKSTADGYVYSSYGNPVKMKIK